MISRIFSKFHHMFKIAYQEMLKYNQNIKSRKLGIFLKEISQEI